MTETIVSKKLRFTQVLNSTHSVATLRSSKGWNLYFPNYAFTRRPIVQIGGKCLLFRLNIVLYGFICDRPVHLQTVFVKLTIIFLLVYKLTPLSVQMIWKCKLYLVALLYTTLHNCLSTFLTTSKIVTTSSRLTDCRITLQWPSYKLGVDPCDW